MTNKFTQDLNYGMKGEIIAYKHLKKLDSVQSIIDVSKNKHFQKLDVDYILTDNFGHELWVEVKYDRKADETGSLVYETKSNGNEGCLARSQADLVYYITKTKIYSFLLEDIRGFIEIVKPQSQKMGDGAEGYLLSIKQLLELDKVRFVREIDEGNMVGNQ